MSKKFFVLTVLLCWLPYLAEAMVFPGWEKHSIGSLESPIYLYVKDMDGDGDLDVASTTNIHPNLYDSEVAWFRNNLNEGLPWEKFIISSSAPEDDPITNSNGIFVSDIDADGHEDVVVATGRVTVVIGSVYWFKAPADPTGQWERFNVEIDANNSYFKIYTMDINEDNMEDILVGGNQGAVAFVNPGNPAQVGAVWEKISFPEETYETGSSLYLDDIDGDGKTDVLNTYTGAVTGDPGNVSWFDVSFDGLQIILDRIMIDSELIRAFDVNCMDVNGDMKKDVIVDTFQIPGIYWYEAPQNNGPWIKHTVSEEFEGTDIYVGKIDPDETTDFVVSGLFEKKISWFEPAFGNPDIVWTEHLVDDNINTPGDISLDDLDQDGDLDIVLAGMGDDQMIWYENKLNEATVVEIVDFTATAGSKKVTLKWKTASETDNAGFNIYRSDKEDGEYKKINSSIIEARGTTAQGASYKFVDENVKNRATYYYKLEDIDIYGKGTLHGPVSATPRIVFGN